MKQDYARFSVPLRGTTSPFWRVFRDTLRDIVYGQDRAVEKIIRSISVLESGLQDSRVPPSPLFFVGPSGSGKTFLAETIAEVWLGAAGRGEISPLVKVAGQELSERHQGTTLTGASPDYIGYGDKVGIEDIGVFEREKRKGALRKACRFVLHELEREYPRLFSMPFDIPIKRVTPQGQSVADRREGTVGEYLLLNLEYHIEEAVGTLAPFRSVLLIDEFEKMHPIVQNQLLGILDTGKLTTHSGREVDFRACQIVLTSNIATDLIAKKIGGNELGFGLPGRGELNRQNQEIYELVRNEVKRQVNSALYSRIGHDGIVVFHMLSEDDYRRIIRGQIRAIEAEIRAHSNDDFSLVTTPAFDAFLLSQADTPHEGAREVRRIILKNVRAPLANLLNTESLREGDEVLFDVDESGSVRLQRASRVGKPKRPVINMSKDEASEEIVEGFSRLVHDFLNQDIFHGYKVPILSPPGGDENEDDDNPQRGGEELDE